MGRDTAFKANLGKRCTGKAKRAAARVRERREAKAARMREVRKLRPTSPGLKRRLIAGLPPGRLGAEMAKLYRVATHLHPKRDGPLVKSYITICAILAEAWAFLANLGWIGQASRSGKVVWAPALEALSKLEAQRLRLAESLLLTPKSLGVDGLAARPEHVPVVLAGDTQEYIRRLRAIRGAPPEPPALPPPPVPAPSGEGDEPPLRSEAEVPGWSSSRRQAGNA